MMFDNRTAMDKAGLGRLQQRFDAVRGIGRNHFGLEIGGRMIGYCYIRKNACSSFKKMFLECSPHRALKRPDQRPIDFIRQHHRLAPGALAACDHLIFAYRDPAERTLSMFRNKFIAQTGATDISASYTRIAGQPPEAATFRSFIEGYLGRRFSQLDRHVLPQRMHLQRVCYTDAIPVQNLHAGMCRVIGPELADQYFLQPVNRTSDVPLQPVSDAADRPVQELREIYARDGYMPDNASLLPAGVADRLRRLYAMDYDIIGAAGNAARPA
ncbi:sulfotransferase family 2 domain-containing protein [Leisingera sp. NJS204]|uniref:sulfotransferase family 2 domain-containing protein n=1 Tax=Leisingera sp. NJS204 TaxID=2508307 RepID=UPI001010C391|nr:sulfotransferase family 2 domain-containing protein [Leisingera sp. NJS204]QAX32124.1 hypothetical protein ETW24_22320 [Leisingera sp. NJS204]